MTALPSFVDLMSSLGLEQKTHPPPSLPMSSCSPPSTPPASPTSARHMSTRGLRDTTHSKQGTCRFSPYSSTLRRGNPSSKSTPEPEQRDQKHRRQSKELLEPDKLDPSYGLTSDSYDTSSDLNVDAPISIYARKRRSGGSLTSLAYPREWNCDTDILLPCIPVMPPLLLDDLYTAIDGETTPADSATTELDGDQDGDLASSRPRQRTGVRLSMPG